ncbi:hypothetical protein OG496_00190 [Streptomyces sp. NBC_00988]|uniref:hypothetical protein n=1 Tax=Streptomyces sp. NBC_00988 TaxID=2903704 RepID=UPI003867E71C|nr:hypothetical protein OG496_00190 [Streptomyces sp. NBC_00988]
MLTADRGPFDGLSVEGVLELLPSLTTFPPATSRRSRSKRADRSRGTARILHWLLSFPGDGWQERWLVSGVDSGLDWGWIDLVTAEYGSAEAPRRAMTAEGLGCVLLARVVRPSYEFLQGYRTSGLYRHAKQEFGAEQFDRIRQAGLARAMIPSQLSTAENSLVKVAFRTGRDLDRLTAEDLIAYHEWSRETFAKAPAGLHAAWDLMCDAGLLSDVLPLRRTVARGQLSTAAMVDRYSIQCRPVRDVLVRYLEERRPSLDYTSLQHLASQLVGAFSADIEKHHPGIDTLDLPTEVAQAWKERIRFITREGKDPIPRQTRTAVLTGVRAFYLDIQRGHWRSRAGRPGRSPVPSARPTPAGSPRSRRRSGPGCTSGCANGCPGSPSWWIPPKPITPRRRNCWPQPRPLPSERSSITEAGDIAASAAGRTEPRSAFSTGLRWC